MTLSDLIAGLDAEVVRGDPARVRVCDLTEDSRTVMPGSLFIARRGTNTDGRKFVGDACELGAVAILSDDPEACSGGACERGAHHRDVGKDVTLVVVPDVALACATIAERFYGNPSSHLGVIGVTGTNGKTTTVHIIHRIMNESGVRCGMMGTVEIDDGREVASAAMTTPPAIEVSRTLAMMVEHGCTHAAMEASSHALDQQRVGAIRFAAGIFTNLTGDHLDYHLTMEAYADAKARLFARLAPDGWAIVNATDPAHERMLRDCKAQVVRCVDRALTPEERASHQSAASGWAGITILERSLTGTVARLEGPWGELTARYRLIGAHNATNVLQAVAACHAMGMAGHAIVEGLARTSVPRGRLEPVDHPDAHVACPTVLIDYAHTDDGLSKALMAVREAMQGSHRSGRLWVVFGAGGEKDRTKRPRMGRVASVIADRVVVTSDNPRREKPSAIVDEIIAGIDPESRKGRVEVQVDRQRAIHHAIEHARSGDVVVIAGKGHETEQILPDGSGGTVRIQFDDREVAAAALAGLTDRIGTE